MCGVVPPNGSVARHHTLGKPSPGVFAFGETTDGRSEAKRALAGALAVISCRFDPRCPGVRYRVEAAARQPVHSRVLHDWLKYHACWGRRRA